jgi:hypothetical protein
MKLLKDLYDRLFPKDKLAIKVEDAIKCDACRVWYLRTHDIQIATDKQRIRTGIINIVFAIVTLFAVAGKLNELINIFIDILNILKTFLQEKLL